MAIKKTELYSSLWAGCDELRGGMDASQYKDYVLTLLFMKYVSDKYRGDPYGMIVVPQGASFDDMVALKGDKEIGEKLNKIISALAEENDLKGVIDVADFNDEDKLGKGKDMIDRLSKLVGIFEGIDLSANRADGDDLLGDAYEYLMRHFATESGKSKGQFYTPAEVSRILAKVIGISQDTPQDASVYDPTCGSGSLLLKASDEAPRGLTIFGQEMDNATSALARMNMILHNNATAKIWKGNTIADPQWKDANGKLKTFDFAVANPPFSNKNWTSGINPQEDEFDRFTWGIPPDKNGDYTFLLHIIKSLKSTGKGAVILPHGVLFRGNAEARIRENLLKQGYIKGIIGLPANLFYGTGIPACIIVIDKQHAAHRSGIFMIDASKGYMKDGNKNRLRAQDIHKIVDAFTKQLVLPRYSRMVALSEIAANDYNLNVPRYIDSSEPEDLHDLSGHLQGGIPNRDIAALQDYWQVFPSLRHSLFAELRPGYSQALISTAQVKPTILNHPEFIAFARQSLQPFTAWRERAALKEIEIAQKPKLIIQRISEDLLQAYANSALLNKYDVYQILMDYWAEVMQDDVYVLVQDGWASFYAGHGDVFVRITNMSRESIFLDLTETKFVLLPYQSSEGKRTSLENGDILVSITADIGICSYVDERLEKPAFINQHVALIRFDKKEIHSKYIAYFLSSENVQKLFKGAADQGAKAGMNLDAVRKIRAAIPSKSEQTAIANALSDVDAMINELEKLIAKKRAIKTATMQQLLTGRTRLPPFNLREDGTKKGYKQSKLGEIPEDWELSTIGNHTLWMSGGTPSRSNEEFWNGSIPWISGSTLKSFEISTSDQFLSVEAVATGSKMAPVGAVLLLVRGSALHNEIRVGMVVAPVAFNQDVKALVPTNGLDSRFLTFFFLAMENELLKLVSSAGNSAGVLDTGLIKNFRLFLPSESEQTTIATILSDMDADIQTLQQRLSKTRQIKQGIMQELLTGRIRLVKPAPKENANV